MQSSHKRGDLRRNPLFSEIQNTLRTYWKALGVICPYLSWCAHSNQVGVLSTTRARSPGSLFGCQMMWTPASGLCSVVDAMNKCIWTTEVLWRKRDGTATLWVRQCPDPFLDRLLLLSNSIHQRRFLFIMLRFALGDYFLQITKERMLPITSYRLTRKKCCKCKGTIRVIGLVTFCPWEN